MHSACRQPEPLLRSQLASPSNREQQEPGGVLTRVASSHIRFGSFQYFSGEQDQASFRRLADYTIDRHYPDLQASEQPYLALLNQVIEQIAPTHREMAVSWIHSWCDEYRQHAHHG